MLGIALVVSGLLTVPPAAQAYDVNSTSTVPTGASGGSGTSLMSVSGITTTLKTSANTSVNTSEHVGSDGSASSTFRPYLASATPMMGLSVGNTTSTGCMNGQTCQEGAVTVTFSQPVTNPVMHVSGIGQALSSSQVNPSTGQRYLWRSYAGFKLTSSAAVSGVSVGSVLAGATNLTSSGGLVTAAASHGSTDCGTVADLANEPAAATVAGCGSVQIVGTAITSLTFSTQLTVTSENGGPAHDGGADPVGMLFTFGQHYSDAPASYGGSQAPAAVVGGLALGSTVSADAATVADPVASPYVASAAAVNSVALGEDALTTWPMLLSSSVGQTYSVSVPVSGATRVGQVCGYVDFTQMGTFSAAADRACTSLAAGQTSVVLTWTVPNGTKPGGTYARLRVNYGTGTTAAASPTGLSGTGEVEDYYLTVGQLAPVASAAQAAPASTSVSASRQQGTAAGDNPVVPDEVDHEGTGLADVAGSHADVAMVQDGSVSATVVGKVTVSVGVPAGNTGWVWVCIGAVAAAVGLVLMVLPARRRTRSDSPPRRSELPSTADTAGIVLRRIQLPLHS